MTRHRAGFTVLEVLVAITMLVVGVLALVGAGSVVTRTLSRGDRTAKAAFFAQQQLETLDATPCSGLANGSATRPGGYTVSWQISGTAGNFRRARLISQYTAVLGIPRADTMEATILCIR